MSVVILYFYGRAPIVPANLMGKGIGEATSIPGLRYMRKENINPFVFPTNIWPNNRDILLFSFGKANV